MTDNIRKFDDKYPSYFRNNGYVEIQSKYKYCLISLHLLVNPYKRDDITSYGTFSVRGMSNDYNKLISKCDDILKNIDNIHRIYVIKTGEWYPICNSIKLSKNYFTTDINTNDNIDDKFISFHSRLAKEKREEQQKIMDNMMKRKTMIENNEDESDINSVEYYKYRLSRSTDLEQIRDKHTKYLNKITTQLNHNYRIIRKILHLHPEYVEINNPQFVVIENIPELNRNSPMNLGIDDEDQCKTLEELIKEDKVCGLGMM